MITPGRVGVGEPTTQTKQIDNVELTQPAPSGELVERQIIGVGDPEDWNKIAKVRGDDPDPTDLGIVVRPIGGATDSNYDSGILDVTDTPTPITAQTTQVRTVLLFNDATQLRHFTLADGDANPYITAMPVSAKSVVPLNFGGAALSNGIVVSCNSGQTSLRVQIVGRQ